MASVINIPDKSYLAQKTISNTTVSAVAFSGNGRYAAAGTRSGIVHIFDLAPPGKLQSIEARLLRLFGYNPQFLLVSEAKSWSGKKEIYALHFRDDGHILIAAVWDQLIEPIDKISENPQLSFTLHDLSIPSMDDPDSKRKNHLCHSLRTDVGNAWGRSLKNVGCKD